MKRVDLVLSRKQFEFVYSDKKLFSYFAGVGTGKTFSGSLFAINQMIKYPKALGFIGANTVKQLNLSTLPPFFGLLEKFEIPHVFNKRPPLIWGKSRAPAGHDGVLSCRINGNLAQAFTWTLENPTYKGISIGWFWIDETADTKSKSIKILFERLRGYNHVYPDMKYKGRFTTTPNGFDYMYDIFVKKPLRDSGYVQAHSSENAKNLPDNFVEDLEEQLGATLAKQQLNGEFISVSTGRAYEFDRRIHAKADIKYNPDLPLIYSMDFNVSPMAAVVMQTDKKTVWILDEICLEDQAQTASCVREFVRRWKGEGLSDGRSKRAVLAWGDRAGTHRDTRGNESDINIMLKTLKEYFVSVKDSQDYAQRHIIDGINAVNALLNPAKGEPRLYVHSSCERVIQDFEQLSFKPGTKELDIPANNEGKQRKHFNDCVRYPIAQMFEIGYSGSGKSGDFTSGGLFA